MGQLQIGYLVNGIVEKWDGKERMTSAINTS
jgi:hypothetical protein